MSQTSRFRSPNTSCRKPPIPGTLSRKSSSTRRDSGDVAGRDATRVELAEQVARDPECEQVDGEATHDLVRPQVDREERVDQREQASEDHRHQQADDPRSAPDRPPHGEEGAEQHHPLEADVHDARPFGEDAADGGEGERCRKTERRGEEPGRQHVLERVDCSTPCAQAPAEIPRKEKATANPPSRFSPLTSAAAPNMSATIPTTIGTAASADRERRKSEPEREHSECDADRRSSACGGPGRSRAGALLFAARCLQVSTEAPAGI